MRLLKLLFGCPCENVSRPITRKRLVGDRMEKVTYCVCLDCGTEYSYDLDTMSRGVSLASINAA